MAMPELDTSLVGKDLSGRDLRHKDLTKKVLFKTNLRGAKLYGAEISVRCETFDGVELDDDQVSLLLLMLAEADIDPAWEEGLRSLVKSVVGDQKSQAIGRYLKVV
jgi:hypothetical protein